MLVAVVLISLNSTSLGMVVSTLAPSVEGATAGSLASDDDVRERYREERYRAAAPYRHRSRLRYPRPPPGHLDRAMVGPPRAAQRGLVGERR